jgi:hypothetical protein
MEYAELRIPVLASDGKQIGTLARVEGPFMCISRGRFRGDYWIPTEYIADASPREVTLEFPSTDVRRFARVTRLPAPRPLDRPDAA